MMVLLVLPTYPSILMPKKFPPPRIAMEGEQVKQVTGCPPPGPPDLIHNSIGGTQRAPWDCANHACGQHRILLCDDSTIVIWQCVMLTSERRGNVPGVWTTEVAS